MSKLYQNLSKEEKLERKKIANKKYYEKKGKDLYKNKQINEKNTTYKLNNNNSNLKITIKNGSIHEALIKDFLEQLINKEEIIT
jgi:hypothetical protein